MNTRDWFNSVQESYVDDWDYQGEYASTLFTEKILKHINVNDIPKNKLAKKLKTSPAYVSKILSGGGNFTLKKIYQICFAVGLDFYWGVKLKPQLTQLHSIKNTQKKHFDTVQATFYKSNQINTTKEIELASLDG